MRNPRQLEAYELARTLIVEVYSSTQGVCPEPDVDPRARLRHAAVSVALRLLEGCRDADEASYLRCLEESLLAAREVGSLAGVCRKEGYLSEDSASSVLALQSETVQALTDSLGAARA